VTFIFGNTFALKSDCKREKILCVHQCYTVTMWRHLSNTVHLLTFNTSNQEKLKRNYCTKNWMFSAYTDKKEKDYKNKDMKGGLRHFFLHLFTFYFNNVIMKKKHE